ncbi:histidine phosphatase family protein [Streptomyces sp. CRN 30]|uniref:SixA phosphatase family protein n=1 Tax=Streptomyces sp. CRN 30 TaxID=3075613 RepID=UPI002A7F7586|nr:histidine phosphatase family protein [Streptomyces sp. CRN 30]
MKSEERRLVVLRHAKSAWPEGVADHDRPLAARGRRDAPAAGRVLAGAGHLPDLVLCSTALRARATWELASAQWDAPPPVRHEGRLYGADAAGLLDVVRAVSDEIRALLVVGHNPGLEELVLLLAGGGSGDALERIGVKFPTSALAVLEWRGADWGELGPGSALLTSVTVPRGARR